MHKLSILQYTGLRNPSFVVSPYLCTPVYCAIPHLLCLYILVYPSILCNSLQCRSSYEAYLQYPEEVSELQELEGLLSGGTPHALVLDLIVWALPASSSLVCSSARAWEMNSRELLLKCWYMHSWNT